MSPEQIERVIAAFDEGMVKSTGKQFEDAMQEGYRILSTLAAKVGNMRTKQQLREQLAGVEELTWAEERALRAMCKFSPHLLRVAFKAMSDKAAETLPNKPGGRPSVLSRDDQIAALKYINKLHFAGGVELGVCFSRATQRFGGSESTMQRIYANRTRVLSGERELSFDEAVESAWAVFASEPKGLKS